MKSVRFREEQVFRSWWMWLLIGGIAVLQWWGFFQQIIRGKPWGNKPAPDWMMVILWLAFGIGLPVFFLYAKLMVMVTETAVDVHFRPMTRRTISIAEITHVETRTYAPLSEYGGWGIRYGRGGKRAYNVSGNRGVELTLANGRKVMIGSQRTDELAQAIEDARGS